MATITIPNTFTPNTTIQSAQVNSNFTTIVNDYNGNVTNANIASGAAIANSKLNLASIAQTISMNGVALNFAEGANLASATTVNIGAATGNSVHITGTTTITGFDTVQAGTWRYLIFDAILTFTHNSTSLILPTGANITTAAGDTALMMSEGSGNWRCLAYNLKSGSPLVAFTAATAPSGTVLQMKNVLTNTLLTDTTHIPLDNTKPQITEGTQVFTLAITPNNASNLLRIDISVNLDDEGQPSTVALFQDSGADALSAVKSGKSVSANTDGNATVAFTFWMAAGTTSATTFKVRFGGPSATTYVNANAGSAVYNGIFYSSMTITEIKA